MCRLEKDILIYILIDLLTAGKKLAACSEFCESVMKFSESDYFENLNLPWKLENFMTSFEKKVKQNPASFFPVVSVL